MNKNIIVAVSVIIILVLGFVVWKYVYSPMGIEENPVQILNKSTEDDTTTKIDESLNSINVDANIDEDLNNLDKDLNNL